MLALMSYNASTVLLLCLVVAAAWADMQHHRIPNLLSLGGIAIGLGLQFGFLGVEALLGGLGGLALCLLIFLPFYALGGMGAGDVKLMAAVGTFLGPIDALLAAGLSLAAGSVMGATILLYRRGAMTALRRYASTLKCLVTTGQLSYVPPAPGEAAATRFPYALAIATGTIAALWWLHYLQRLASMLEWYIYG